MYTKFLMHVVAVAGLLFSLSYAFNQYIQVKNHNLNVLAQVVNCAVGLDGQAVKDCAAKAKSEYIGVWKIPESNSANTSQ